MKKLLIISSITLLCAFTSNINAQFNIGPIAGLNVSNLDVKDNDLSSVWNWGAGIVANYYFTENIAVQLEPMYLLKGGVIEAKEGDPRFDISLSYIEVPILFKYDFGKKENFYLLAGLSVGYLLSSNIEAELNGYPFEADMKETTNNVDLGGTLGAGIKFPAGSSIIFLEAKYTLGLVNLQKGGTTYFTSDSINLELPMTMDSGQDAFNTYGIQLMAGVTFAL